jgi:cellulose synthase/poly-beta-1,6-N-acetylglucosamine synthase-like glycosyltransferase
MQETSAPRTSVIIPTYNRAGVIGRAIQSVLAQSFHDWELFVVDDGSSDNTESVVASFDDARIQFIRHPYNRGKSAARNTGIGRARGDWISFLDSDDEWEPDKLSCEHERIRSVADSVGLLYCGKRIREDKGRLLRVRMPTKEGQVYQSLLEWDFIGSCSRVTVRREAVLGADGYDETFANTEDWDLWLRIAKRYEVAAVRRCLVTRYFGSQQVPDSVRSICAGKECFLQKHGTEMPARVRAKHLAALATMLMNYDAVKARAMAYEAMQLDWKQPRLIAAMLCSILGQNLYRHMFLAATKRLHGLYIGRAKI